MAKRFTDTNKWDQSWFRKLSPTFKCVWAYLCDKCDHAGVWEIDLETMSHFINDTVSIDQLKTSFADKIRFISDDKILIQAFIDFQYGTLNPENRVHKSVILRLEKFENKDLIRTFQGAKDKEQYKDKEKDKEKETDFSNISNSTMLSNVALQNSKEIEEIQNLLSGENALHEDFPPFWKKGKTNFCARILVSYDFNLEDFKRDLKSIINESLLDKIAPSGKSDYIISRIKKKALEMHNAAQ